MKISSDLHKAFLQTKYVISSNQYHKESIKLMIGKDFNQLDVYPDFKSFGFLTAWNPLPSILTNDENKARNLKLKSEIEKLGYFVFDGLGVSKDQSRQETSFFILNIDLKTLNGLAKKYGQLAFVYGEIDSLAKLIYV